VPWFCSSTITVWRQKGSDLSPILRRARAWAGVRVMKGAKIRSRVARASSRAVSSAELRVRKSGSGSCGSPGCGWWCYVKCMVRRQYLPKRMLVRGFYAHGLRAGGAGGRLPERGAGFLLWSAPVYVVGGVAVGVLKWVALGVCLLLRCRRRRG
jgi:hypothetical protein